MKICEDCQVPGECAQVQCCLLKYIKSKDIKQPEPDTDFELDDLPEVTEEDHSTFVVHN